jgi:hypothetical protein
MIAVFASSTYASDDAEHLLPLQRTDARFISRIRLLEEISAVSAQRLCRVSQRVTYRCPLNWDFASVSPPWRPCSVSMCGISLRRAADQPHEDRARRWGGTIGVPCGEVTRTGAPGFLSASRRRVIAPTPLARHLPGLTNTIQLFQNKRLAVRWSLGRGNALVPSS